MTGNLPLMAAFRSCLRTFVRGIGSNFAKWAVNLCSMHHLLRGFLTHISVYPYEKFGLGLRNTTMHDSDVLKALDTDRSCEA